MPCGRYSTAVDVPLLLHRKNFHYESQRRIGRNHSGNTTRAISSLWWTSQCSLTANIDVLDTLGPAWDDAIERKSGWLTTFIRTIELRAISECAAVIDYDRISRLWRYASTRFNGFDDYA